MRTVEDFNFDRNPYENLAADLFEWDGFFVGGETMEAFSSIDAPADWENEPERRFELPDEEEEPHPLSSQALPEEKSTERSEEIIRDWEGVVDEVLEDEGIFSARLCDLTAGEIYPSETAEIPIEDVSDDDRELLRPGAVFYLTTGRSLRRGRWELFGRMAFRRLPSRTPADLRRIEERARSLIDFLGLES